MSYNKYYDVMYRESYGWYTIALAFDMAEEEQDQVTFYDFDGIEDMGIHVRTYGKRVVITIYCMLDHSQMPYNDNNHYENQFFEEDKINEFKNIINNCCMLVQTRLQQIFIYN